jgi:hypothetical protein
MKKIILLTLALACHSAFAAKPSENIEYYKMGNYVAKEACMLAHFQNVDALIDLKGGGVKQAQDADIQKALGEKIKLIGYENTTKVIFHSMDFSQYYLVENKKAGNQKLYKITDAKLKPIKPCIVLLEEYKPQNEAIASPKDL